MYKHIPVLPDLTIKYLAPAENENFIDATCGLGGHSKLILEKTGPNGRLLAIDQDADALSFAEENLKKFRSRVEFANCNFSELGLVIRKWKVDRVDGILFDLGVSSYQLDNPERGFSFAKDAPLDMRMSQDRQQLTAAKIVNKWRLPELVKVLKEFGEEPFASQIARKIVQERLQKPIETTQQLVEVIKKTLPPKYRIGRDTHFATSTFRALRMAVNDELSVLESALKQAVQILSPGGRLVVITFHSLEDRIVKKFLLSQPNLEVLTKKPLIADENEITSNPRARSAKLRSARRI